MDLTGIRRNIDDLDSMIITLLAKRAVRGGAAGRPKEQQQGVRGPERVREGGGKVQAKTTARGLACESPERPDRTVHRCNSRAAASGNAHRWPCRGAY